MGKEAKVGAEQGCWVWLRGPVGGPLTRAQGAAEIKVVGRVENRGSVRSAC